MSTRNAKHIVNIAYYMIFLLFIGEWVWMMIFPDYWEARGFRLVLQLTIVIGALYSIFQKKNYPEMKRSKAGKLIAAVMIVTALARILFR